MGLTPIFLSSEIQPTFRHTRHVSHTPLHKMMCVFQPTVHKPVSISSILIRSTNMGYALQLTTMASLNSGRFHSKLDVAKELSLVVKREDAMEKYDFRYFNIEIY